MPRYLLPEPDVVRVDARAECPVCRRPYGKHPFDYRILDYAGEPFMLRGCETLTALKT